MKLIHPSKLLAEAKVLWPESTLAEMKAILDESEIQVWTNNSQSTQKASATAEVVNTEQNS